MRCKTIQKKLALYLAEELTASDQRQIEAHLRSCPVCRDELARVRQLLALLKSDSMIPPVPEGFTSRLMVKARQRLAARQPPEMPVPWSIRRWWTSVSLPLRVEAAAMLAAGLLIGVLMGQQTWHSTHRSTPHRATQADPLAVYELDYLSDAPGGSLVESFLTLTGGSSGNGA
jgi:anti-sigma factor RsiW